MAHSASCCTQPCRPAPCTRPGDDLHVHVQLLSDLSPGGMTDTHMLRIHPRALQWLLLSHRHPLHNGVGLPGSHAASLASPAPLHPLRSAVWTSPFQRLVLPPVHSFPACRMTWCACPPSRRRRWATSARWCWSRASQTPSRSQTLSRCARVRRRVACSSRGQRQACERQARAAPRPRLLLHAAQPNLVCPPEPLPACDARCTPFPLCLPLPAGSI